MSNISGSGCTRADHAEVARGWGVGYAVRRTVAMGLAVVGIPDADAADRREV